MVKTGERLLIIPDFIFILKELKDGEKTLTDIHEKLRMTYAHLFYLKEEMLLLKWIDVRTEGVSKYITLTDKGNDVLDKTNLWLQCLGINDENMIEYRRVKTKKVIKKEVKEDD